MTSLKWTLKAVSKLKEGANPPTIVDVTPLIELLGERVALGGSCDIYKGRMHGKGWVAIKRPRVMELNGDVLKVGIDRCTVYLYAEQSFSLEIQYGG